MHTERHPHLLRLGCLWGGTSAVTVGEAQGTVGEAQGVVGEKEVYGIRLLSVQSSK